MTKEITTNDAFTTIRDMIKKQEAGIKAAIPRHMTVERVARIALTTFRTNPALLECTPESLLGALMQCAQLGFELNNLTGHVHLIPFNNRKKKVKEAQLIIGYQGMLDMMWRSGKLMSINTHIVYENEFSNPSHFTVLYGTNPELKHIPMPPSKRGKEKIGVYVIASLKDGGKVYEWMWAEEVVAIRNESPAYKAAKKYGNQSIWNTHEEAMWRKTVIRRAAKYMPKSVEMQDLLIAEATSTTEAWDIATIPDAEVINTTSENVGALTEERTQELSGSLGSEKTAGQTSLEEEFEADAKAKGI